MRRRAAGIYLRLVRQVVIRDTDPKAVDGHAWIRRRPLKEEQTAITGRARNQELVQTLPPPANAPVHLPRRQGTLGTLVSPHCAPVRCMGLFRREIPTPALLIETPVQPGKRETS